MAIKRYAGDRFTGLAADIKPTNTLSGAQFTELDTGKIFFYDGTTWNESTSDIPSSFSNVAVSGQTTVQAESTSDTLTLLGSGATTITTDAAIDQITISSTDTNTYLSAINAADLSNVVFTISGDNATTINANLAPAFGDITGITGTKDGTKFLRDDGTWANIPTDVITTLTGEDGIEVTNTGSDYTIGLTAGFAGSGLNLNAGVLSVDFSAAPTPDVTDVTTPVGSGLTVTDTSGDHSISINSAIAGEGLGWASGVINLESSIAGKALTYTSGVIDVDMGDPGDADLGTYTRVAPLDGSYKIPMVYLPNNVKESTVVADIAARDAITGADLYEGLRVHVLDASADATVTAGHAGYIYTGTVWEKTYEDESLDITIPTAVGAVGEIQYADGSGAFQSSANFSFDSVGQKVNLTGGILTQEGGTVPTVGQNQAYTYVTTETVGPDVITRYMSRIGDGQADVIIASYISPA